MGMKKLRRFIPLAALLITALFTPLLLGDETEVRPEEHGPTGTFRALSLADEAPIPASNTVAALQPENAVIVEADAITSGDSSSSECRDRGPIPYSCPPQCFPGCRPQADACYSICDQSFSSCTQTCPEGDGQCRSRCFEQSVCCAVACRDDFASCMCSCGCICIE